MARTLDRLALAAVILFGYGAFEPTVRAGRQPSSTMVHALFDLVAPTSGPFPSDWFTVVDPSHNTGRRVTLPKADCVERPSDCEDIEVLNTLDGFNLQPRLSIPFDGSIDVETATSNTIFLLRLGDTLDRADRERIVGINQIVWDPATNTLHVESDELLEQHTRYAVIVTRGVRDSFGAPVEATDAFRRFRHTVRGDYKHALLEAIHAAQRVGVRENDIAVASVFTTQSVTAILEKIRDQIKAATPPPADFHLGSWQDPDSVRTGRVTGITWTQPTRRSAAVWLQHGSPGESAPARARESKEGVVKHGSRMASILSRKVFSFLLGFPLAGSAQGQSMADTVRFLEQAAFGPTPQLIAHVQAVGFEPYLEEQFNLPIRQYPDVLSCPTPGGYCPQTPPLGCGAGTECFRLNYTMWPLQRWFFENALNGDVSSDQLRQRVAFALNQIMVVSAEDAIVRLPQRMLPYLQVLNRNAFGNYRDLLHDITLNPGIGSYLATVGSRAENPNATYARVILELFSVGPHALNPDGTPMLDREGRPIPTYDDEIVTNFARAFTGWEFALPPAPGIPNFWEPMRVRDQTLHDRGEKRLLSGVTLPAGQSAEQDLRDALDNIFTHPNVGPFIGKRLIQHLVTSNPTPGYVARITQAFTDNGAGVRGDMEAIISAILLDSEARDIPSSQDFGHLKEPVVWVAHLLRAFNTTPSTTDFVLGERFLPADLRMNQDIFHSPTVFGFFPPDYAIPGRESLLGPEFGIHSVVTSLARTNFACSVILNQEPCILGPSADRPSGTRLLLTSLEPLAEEPVQLVEYLNNLLLHGAMTSEMRAIVTKAIAKIPGPAARVKEAVYLIATGSQYLTKLRLKPTSKRAQPGSLRRLMSVRSDRAARLR